MCSVGLGLLEQAVLWGLTAVAELVGGVLVGRGW